MRHLDRLVRQAAADVGEQPARDQRPALLADVGVERGAGRGLVVEGGEPQTVARPSPSRPRSAGRRARGRWAGSGGAGRPGDGIGEDVTFDAELHGWSSPRRCFGLRRHRRAAGCASCHAGLTHPRRGFSTQVGPAAVVARRGINWNFVVVVGAVDSVDNPRSRRSAPEVVAAGGLWTVAAAGMTVPVVRAPPGVAECPQPVHRSCSRRLAPRIAPRCEPHRAPCRFGLAAPALTTAGPAA